MIKNATTCLIALFILACGGADPLPVSPTYGNKSACLATELPSNLSSCSHVLEPYIRYDDPDAFRFTDVPVHLYFYPQAPPENTTRLRQIKSKGASNIKGGSCRLAAIQALLRLQSMAHRYEPETGSNAVVNIRSVWNGVHLGDELYFGCIMSRGRYVVLFEGALAKIDHDAENESIEKRLKELEELYYKSLITKEEFEQRRKAILGEL